MLREIDLYFLQKDEPVKSSLLFLREFILGYDSNITEAWKYKMPFFCFDEKMFCYLWVDKKIAKPYIGIVEGKKIKHRLLVQEKRAGMKFMIIDPETDLPISDIDAIFKMGEIGFKKGQYH